MDILAKARTLESRLARSVDRAAARLLPVSGREPLEIVHAVIEAVDREVQPAGRGRHLFPFNRIRVFVLAPSRQTKARLEAVFGSEPTLLQRIASRLEAAGCAPNDLAVDVSCVAEPADGWEAPDLHIEFERLLPAAPTARLSAPGSIELMVVSGIAGQPQYAFAQSRIDLGRCAEVRDRRNRLLRTNHVAFEDRADRPNQTVSRRHAHVICESATGEFRIYDDGSEQGTGIVRSGRTIAIPPGARGVRLQPGDEILLGQARVRVTF
jgi:hypothetical protein